MGNIYCGKSLLICLYHDVKSFLKMHIKINMSIGKIEVSILSHLETKAKHISVPLDLKYFEGLRPIFKQFVVIWRFSWVFYLVWFHVMVSPVLLSFQFLHRIGRNYVI